MKLPSRVTLCEVGLRDGLQNEPSIMPHELKLKLLRQLVEAGFKVIETGSFVSPKAVPQMADTDALFSDIGLIEGVELRALIANEKGLDRALACGCRKVKLNVSACRVHNQKNLNRSPEESMALFKPICERAQESGIEVSGSISMPFGSPWQAKIPAEDLRIIIETYLEAGVREISLSDTSGMAVPTSVFKLCCEVSERWPEVSWWLHFHNTRGAAMANILAAMQAGMTRFDTSFAGLGGCPFVPGAAGNIATEDVLHMLKEMGIETGLNMEQCLAIAKEAQAFAGRSTDSCLLRAGSADSLRCTQTSV